MVATEEAGDEVVAAEARSPPSSLPSCSEASTTPISSLSLKKGLMCSTPCVLLLWSRRGERAGELMLFCVQPMDVPETKFPSEWESIVARRFNHNVSEMKFTPFLIEAPTKASSGTSALS